MNAFSNYPILDALHVVASILCIGQILQWATGIPVVQRPAMVETAAHLAELVIPRRRVPAVAQRHRYFLQRDPDP